MGTSSPPAALRVATAVVVVPVCLAMDLADGRFDYDLRVVFDPPAALAMLDPDRALLERLWVASDRVDPAG